LVRRASLGAGLVLNYESGAFFCSSWDFFSSLTSQQKLLAFCTWSVFYAFCALLFGFSAARTFQAGNFGLLVGRSKLSYHYIQFWVEEWIDSRDVFFSIWYDLVCFLGGTIKFCESKWKDHFPYSQANGYSLFGGNFWAFCTARTALSVSELISTEEKRFSNSSRYTKKSSPKLQSHCTVDISSRRWKSA